MPQKKMPKYDYYKERFATTFAPAIKMWSNGIPIKTDTWQSCWNACKYCYADEFRASTLGRIGIAQNIKVARVLDIKRLAKFFENAYNFKDERTPFMNWALRSKYFIEVGTTGETFQDADRYFGVTYNFMKILSDFGIPFFTNTKFNTPVYTDRYKRMLIEHRAPVLLCLSMITVDDEVAKIYEPLSPLPSEILKTVKELSVYPHIRSIVYISPFTPGVTDENPEEFMDKLIDAGVKGAHVRGLLMQGEGFKSAFWKDYYAKNKDKLGQFPGGFHASMDSRMKFLYRAQAHAIKRDPDFRLVGMKKHWFDLPPYHGKMQYEILPDSFKNGFTDFSALPIMRTIRKNKTEPQLLYWSELGFSKDQINLPERVVSNEGGMNTLMEGLCNCNTSDMSYEMKGEDWLSGALWNGWNDAYPENSFMTRLERIFPVKDGEKYVKDSEGHFAFAYVPPEQLDLVTSGNGQSFLFTPSEVGKAKKPYVEWNLAKTFLVPNRPKGIQDKYWTKEALQGIE